MTPIEAMLAARPHWQRRTAAVLLGAAVSLGQAPLGWSWILALALSLVFLAMTAPRSVRGAGRLGLSVGFGYFAVTLAWIVEPFLVDIARHGWMAPFALTLMALGMALFWAAAFAAARWLGGIWALAVTWPLAELARAYVFTGFPWAMLPQGLLDTPAAQGLALIGPHGMMFALCSLMAALVWRRATAVPAAALLIAALFAPVLPPDGPLTPHVVRVVQPNAPQRQKFDPAFVPIFNQRLMEATGAGTPPALVVWPEIAIPYLMRSAQPIFDEAAIQARGAQVVLGLQRRDENLRYFNALAVLDGPRVTQVYDKYHLVPFGEYMPLAPLVSRLGMRGLAAVDLAGYARGAGPQLLDLGVLGMALPLICYEAVFAHRAGATPVRPAMILHITNDAWFGRFQGPQQHLAQARMRAIEQGVPVVRAANTGISGVIDPFGRVLTFLPLGAQGYVDHALPRPRAATLYARTGDLPVALLLLGAAGVATLWRIRIDAATRRA